MCAYEYSNNTSFYIMSTSISGYLSMSMLILWPFIILYDVDVEYIQIRLQQCLKSFSSLLSLKKSEYFYYLLYIKVM